MTNRVALITGGSRGIGSQLLSALDDGNTTLIGVSRSPVAEWERSHSEGVSCVECDITDESAVKRLFSSVRKDYGRLDLVVNNAGVFNAQLLLSSNFEKFDAVLRTNLIAAHVVTREAVKMMIPNGTGRVISISSIAAEIPAAGNALYAISKSGLEELMRHFAVEFRDSGITFNSIAVSFIDDSGMVDLLRPEARASYESRLLAPSPIGIGEIAAAIRYLAGDDASSITGQVISLGSPY